MITHHEANFNYVTRFEAALEAFNPCTMKTKVILPEWIENTNKMLEYIDNECADLIEWIKENA